MRKLMHILKGWGKSTGILSTTPAEEKLSSLRMAICVHCLFSNPSKVLVILKGNATYEKSLQCTKCTCPCLEKSLVIDETCPIQKW